MPLLDKNIFVSDIQDKLDDYIPAKQSKQIIADIRDILARYEIVVVQDETIDGETESMQYLQQFLTAKDVEGRSPNTIERYRYIMSRFMEDVKVPLKKVTTDHIRQYMSQEKQRGISMTTIKGNCYVLSAFYGWMRNEGIITIDPMVAIGTIKAPQNKENPFTDVELYKIKKACKSKKQNLLVHFLMYTGCRVSEVCSLNEDDVDWINRRITVIGKGEKKRYVYLDDVTATLLKEYLNKRKDDSPALIADRFGKRWTPDLIRLMLKQIGKAAGVDRVHPHRFRHTMATRLVDKGMEIQEVSQLLGHSKLDTTMIYVTVNQRNTENSYRKYACM